MPRNSHPPLALTGFQRCRTTGHNHAAYAFFEEEYWHQREVGVRWTQGALAPNSHLDRLVAAELESYEYTASQASMWTDPSALGFATQHHHLVCCGYTGGISPGGWHHYSFANRGCG